jgi:hypothetical protein
MNRLCPPLIVVVFKNANLGGYRSICANQVTALPDEPQGRNPTIYEPNAGQEHDDKNEEGRSIVVEMLGVQCKPDEHQANAECPDAAIAYLAQALVL